MFFPAAPPTASHSPKRRFGLLQLSCRLGEPSSLDAGVKANTGHAGKEAAQDEGLEDQGKPSVTEAGSEAHILLQESFCSLVAAVGMPEQLNVNSHYRTDIRDPLSGLPTATTEFHWSCG